MDKRIFSTYVIRILDDKTILINYGTDDNESLLHKNLDELKLSVGDKIKIIEPGPEITDPLSDTSLGYLDFTKETLEIVQMFPQFSMCQKITRETVPVGAFSALSELSKNRTTETIKSLAVNNKDIETIEFGLKDPKIKIGDPVIFA